MRVRTVGLVSFMLLFGLSIVGAEVKIRRTVRGLRRKLSVETRPRIC
jgi:hypothetical protein